MPPAARPGTLAPLASWVIGALLGAGALALPIAHADPDYHLVGWLNAVLPGSGQALLGDYALAGAQFTLEVSTFGLGYSQSPLTPLTIDGVPQTLPTYTPFSRARNASNTTFAQVDIEKGIYSEWLQEFGLKYHFVNTFDAYREAARRRGVTEGIDQTPTWDLFKAPFVGKNVVDPWVGIPLLVSVAAVAYDYSTYFSQGFPRYRRFTPYSNALYAATYAGVIPVGSGVPEEMFYRGFLQGELDHVMPSPYLSIATSSALYALSHMAGIDRSSALVTGLYLGYLAERNHGALTPGITYHFWADVITGIEAVLISQRAQRSTPPAGFVVQVNY